MSVTRVLITVTTYPLPSRSYDELVCTAGVREDGTWIRIYPVPFSFLNFGKYQWIELDLIEQDRSHDFRPESYRPKNPDLSDLKIIGQVDTKQNWLERKQLCLVNQYTDMSKAIEASHAPHNVSLISFKPKKITQFISEDDDPEWKALWLEQLRQVDMFTRGAGETVDSARVPIEKIPYKFKYRFEDANGRSSVMTIEDWEIGALYRNCLKSAEGDESVAIQKVKQKFDSEFREDKEISLFLGTTLAHHRKRHNNPFTIIGTFYPPIDKQASLFN